MRFGVSTKTGQVLARGTALSILALVAAGCSANVSRFQDSLFTGTTAQASQQPASQSYPGGPGIDTMQTASVSGTARHPVPSVGVGNGGQQIPTQSAAAQQQPFPSSQNQAGTSQVSRGALPPPSGTQATAGTTQSQQQTMGQTSSSQASGQQTVTIESGDTIYSLARRHGVSAAAIIQANSLADASSLQLGQRITIPAGGQAPVVAQGEGVLGTLPANNDNSPSQNEPERVAVLPQPSSANDGASNAASASGGESQNGSPAGRTYIVASGDTLNAISRKTGVSSEALRQANGLDSGLIRIGQTLTIPDSGQQVASVAPRAQNNVDPQPTGAVSVSGNDVQESAPSVPQSEQSDSSVEEAAQQEAAISPGSSGISQMRWPVRGRVTAGFGQTVDGRPNDGIDISVPNGTSVHAAEDGVVIFAGAGLKDFGNTVLVRHEDGLVTVYGHASEIKVERGATVSRGQEIALSGMSGSAEAPKVHFEVRKDSRPVDPSGYLE